MDESFWSKRYQEKSTGWDIGAPSPPLISYVQQRFKDKSTSILIPGAGRAYEAEFLWNLGYKQITLCDFAPEAKQDFIARLDSFPPEQYLIGDFFKLEMQFDLILEQTFFCALDPAMRIQYVQKMAELLNKGGRLAGVLFNFEKADGPPFGGSKEEYLALFSKHFTILKMDECYNSIGPRLGSELFFELTQNQS